MPIVSVERRALIHAHATRQPYKSSLAADGEEYPDITLDDFARIFPACWMCGWSPGKWADGKLALAIHHIERRPHCYLPHRDRSVNLFRACNVCHEGPLATMKHAEQLAWKWWADNAGWATLDEFTEDWLRVRDPALRAPNRVTPDEIEDHTIALGLDKKNRPIYIDWAA